MTGTWLRGPTMPEPPCPHTCEPPEDSSIGRGAIWRCPCRRRWIVVDRIPAVPAGNGTLGRPGRPVWKRRRLPWPRRTAEERRQAASQFTVSVYEPSPIPDGCPPPPPFSPDIRLTSVENKPSGRGAGRHE